MSGGNKEREKKKEALRAFEQRVSKSRETALKRQVDEQAAAVVAADNAVKELEQENTVLAERLEAADEERQQYKDKVNMSTVSLVFHVSDSFLF